MFQNRMIDELFDTAIKYGTVNPGAITTGSKYSASVTLYNDPGLSSPDVETADGDDVAFIFPPASAGHLGGLMIDANPVGSTIGSVDVNIYNASAGTITPASAVWKFVIVRTKANVVS